MALSDYKVGGAVNRRQTSVRAGRSTVWGEPVIEMRIPGANNMVHVTVFDLLSARDLAQRLVAALTEAAVEVEGELRSLKEAGSDG